MTKVEFTSRFYCHSSERQGRDENGCNCHIISASYQCQALLVTANPGRYFYNFLDEFKKEIRNLLSRRHGTKRVFASKMYQKYIAHKEHIHVNATRWNSLSVDNNPKALARQAFLQKMDRTEKDDEERDLQMLREQFE
ncbi:domain of Kin17 curved DNA-binding protein-domain-containing protein [Mucor mucedo]|uniref:domain of Kin17 curved DNA-binding protein-domain-containing protein n=1 Tax=Mucor mucedo TaxID=29922 RepID=UPI00221EEA27|nr:domain of Kin17 curved DNA-binding protein-domain-containing protein [Mucor mucedo]KAI7867907.1 domain of Kin17 curved DNA-binding protein-domain-containing protein [Mucor mucedo]